MKYTDQQRIQKIISTVEKLLAYIEKEDITREEVEENEVVRWAITTPLYNIGEHAYYLTDEYKWTHGEILWAKISELRHRLVHDYDNTNWSVINAVNFDILPEFLKDIKTLQSK